MDNLNKNKMIYTYLKLALNELTDSKRIIKKVDKNLYLSGSDSAMDMGFISNLNESAIDYLNKIKEELNKKDSGK